MGLSTVLPLTEAATFTFGCAILRAQWFEPGRITITLFAVLMALAAMLLIVLTPEAASPDAWALDPTWIWPTPSE